MGTTTTTAITTAAAFKPKSREVLHDAVDDCLNESGDCSTGGRGPIGSWDVSSVITPTTTTTTTTTSITTAAVNKSSSLMAQITREMIFCLSILTMTVIIF